MKHETLSDLDLAANPASMNLIYIVVWSHGDGADDWRTFDQIADAKDFYAELLAREDLFSASICVPVDSTHYPCISLQGAPRRAALRLD